MKTNSSLCHTAILASILATCTVLPHAASAVEFSMFGDALYSSHSHNKGFNIGAIDLTAEETVSDSTTIAAEILIEDGGHGIEVEIERYSITRTIGESHQIKIGRFVKPLGFWNHNFFHGSLSQDTVSRPFFFEYVDQHEGIFPSHLIGALFTGEAGPFTYQFGLANPHGVNLSGGEEGDHFELRALNSGSPGSDKSLVMRGTWLVMDSLELGFMFLNTKIVQTSDSAGTSSDPSVAGSTTERGDTLFDQTVIGFDFNYTLGKFYTFGEYYLLSFKDNQSLINANSSYNAKAHYWQFGYKFTDTLSLALRTESLTYSPGNTFLELLSLPQEAHNLVALHYRLEASNSIRLELRSEDRKGPDADKVTSVNLQWSFYLL